MQGDLRALCGVHAEAQREGALPLPGEADGSERLRRGGPGEAESAHLGILRPAFDNFLPVGATNPFRAGKQGKRRTAAEQSGDSIHRRPFTPDELGALVNAAKDDAFMGGLLTAALCTGMRRGDVCRLKWTDVDLTGGMLAVKTAKTGAQVEIPIFRPLRAVFEDRKGKGSVYVFPEAARMLEENPDGLTWRFKKLVVKALEKQQAPALPSVRAVDVEAVVAIGEQIPEGARRDRVLDTLASSVKKSNVGHDFA